MSHRIQDLPEEDRPRERLLRLGATALTDAELLAIFINTGTKGENAVQVAQRLLRTYQNSLREISRRHASDLIREVKALGPAKAAHVAAAFELGRRAEKERVIEKPLDSPERVYDLVGSEMQSFTREVLRVVLLNTRLGWMRTDDVFTGSVNETMAHPREILKTVLLHSAYAFIVVHNHPSGDPSPSDADMRMTRNLMEAAEVMKLNFFDHLIIGAPSEARSQPYFSFREAGLMG
jgi:DNA repair protein RadC